MLYTRGDTRSDSNRLGTMNPFVSRNAEHSSAHFKSSSTESNEIVIRGWNRETASSDGRNKRMSQRTNRKENSTRCPFQNYIHTYQRHRQQDRIWTTPRIEGSCTCVGEFEKGNFREIKRKRTFFEPLLVRKWKACVSIGTESIVFVLFESFGARPESRCDVKHTHTYWSHQMMLPQKLDSKVFVHRRKLLQRLSCVDDEKGVASSAQSTNALKIDRLTVTPLYLRQGHDF